MLLTALSNVRANQQVSWSIWSIKCPVYQWFSKHVWLSQAQKVQVVEKDKRWSEVSCGNVWKWKAETKENQRKRNRICRTKSLEINWNFKLGPGISMTSLDKVSWQTVSKLRWGQSPKMGHRKMKQIPQNWGQKLLFIKCCLNPPNYEMYTVCYELWVHECT